MEPEIPLSSFQPERLQFLHLPRFSGIILVVDKIWATLIGRFKGDSFPTLWN
jgi:hypothetical protein